MNPDLKSALIYLGVCLIALGLMLWNAGVFT